MSLNPYVAFSLWAADRAGAKDELLSALTDGIVICDRYVPSNLAYQGAKLEGNARATFIDFDEKAEYEELGLPRPDLVVYLRVLASISSQLSSSRGVQDQHEASLEYQERVAGVYCELAASRPNWKIVECVKSGTMRAPDDIHGEIVRIVSSFLAQYRSALP